MPTETRNVIFMFSQDRRNLQKKKKQKNNTENVYIYILYIHIDHNAILNKNVHVTGYNYEKPHIDDP